MSISLVMPSLGESVIEGTVTKWLVHEGDIVVREQSVVSVATDKADSDVPAMQGGKIVKILAPEGATVKVGEPLCEIEVGATASPVLLPPPAVDPQGPGISKRRSTPPPANTAPASPAPVNPAPEPAARESTAPSSLDNGGRVKSSPVVRKLAL